MGSTGTLSTITALQLQENSALLGARGSKGKDKEDGKVCRVWPELIRLRLKLNEPVLRGNNFATTLYDRHSIWHVPLPGTYHFISSE